MSAVGLTLAIDREAPPVLHFLMYLSTQPPLGGAPRSGHNPNREADPKAVRAARGLGEFYHNPALRCNQAPR